MGGSQPKPQKPPPSPPAAVRAPLPSTKPKPKPAPAPAPEPAPTLFNKPWRKIDWSPDYQSKLKEQVTGLAPETRGELKVEFFNIFLTGQIHSGKSSFYNSLNSVFCQRIVERAESGTKGKSLTKEFCIYEIRPTPSSPPLSWRICDTMGLEYANDNSDVKNILKAIGGHVPNGYEFNEGKEFDDDTPQYICKPTIAEKAHCVAVVVDASQLRVMQDGMWEKLKMLRSTLIDRKVPTFILLTHIDKACPEVEKDLTNLSRSISIHDNVKLVARKLLGLSENHVFPVKNYSSETETDTNTDILLLLAIRQMLYNAQGHLENQISMTVTREDRVLSRLPPLSIVLAFGVVVVAIGFFFLLRFF